MTKHEQPRRSMNIDCHSPGHNPENGRQVAGGMSTAKIALECGQNWATKNPLGNGKQ